MNEQQPLTCHLSRQVMLNSKAYAAAHALLLMRCGCCCVHATCTHSRAGPRIAQLTVGLAVAVAAAAACKQSPDHIAGVCANRWVGWHAAGC